MHALPQRPIARPERVDNQGRSRESRSYQAFRQHRQPQRHPRQPHPVALGAGGGIAHAAALRQHQGQHAKVEKEGHAHVERVDVADQHVKQTAGADSRRQHTGLHAPKARAHQAHQQHTQKTAQGRPETRSPVRHAEDFVSGGGGPILKRRFLEILEAVLAWCNPVAGGDHFARHFGVAALVRPDQFARLQIAEPDHRQHKQQRPQHAAPDRRAGA